MRGWRWAAKATSCIASSTKKTEGPRVFVMIVSRGSHTLLRSLDEAHQDFITSEPRDLLFRLAKKQIPRSLSSFVMTTSASKPGSRPPDQTSLHRATDVIQLTCHRALRNLVRRVEQVLCVEAR